MIFVLTVRNKSNYHVWYKGILVKKLVLEFATVNVDSAMIELRDILRDFRCEDAYLHREFDDAMDATAECAPYNSCHSSLQIDWKEIK